MNDKEGTKIKVGDYVEALFNKRSMARRGLAYHHAFKSIKKHGIIEKVCPKTLKVRYPATGKNNYMYGDEIRKMTGEEAMFYTLQTAEKIG